MKAERQRKNDDQAKRAGNILLASAKEKYSHHELTISNPLHKAMIDKRNRKFVH